MNWTRPLLFGGPPPLESGEKRLFVVRSHMWLPIYAALPLPLLTVSPVLFAALDLAIPVLHLGSVASLYFACLATVIILYFMKWFCFDLLPWTQRVYILTDRRFIIQFGVLSVRRRECSLFAVVETDYRLKGVVSRLLDIGDVDMRTAGLKAPLVLKSVPHPRKIQGMVATQAYIVAETRMPGKLSESTDEIMRQLSSITGNKPRIHAQITEKVRVISQKQISAQQRINLLPDETVVEVIKQHPIILALGIAGPILSGFTLMVAGFSMGRSTTIIAVDLIGLVCVPWGVWRVLLYRGHQFILTSDRLMEIRQLPVLYDKRVIVQLTAVQDIMIEAPSLFGRLANIGDVIAEVSDSDQRIVFKTVPDPSSIQKLIFETKDARQRRRNESQDRRTAGMMALWFEEYHKLQQES